MSETPNQEDELAGTEQPFVQHLMELRDRLVKAMIAVGVVAAALFFYPGPGQLYDFLAAPLVAHLPQGATMIATSVISPFMVPLKILLMSAFLVALPFVLWQVWAFVAPGLYSHEKRLVLPLVVSRWSVCPGAALLRNSLAKRCNQYFRSSSCGSAWRRRDSCRTFSITKFIRRE